MLDPNEIDVLGYFLFLYYFALPKYWERDVPPIMSHKTGDRVVFSLALAALIR
jgi:hypothetical protein